MNLEVAITVSRRPGYFKYYTGTEEVKKVRVMMPARPGVLKHGSSWVLRCALLQVENSHRLSQLVSKIRVVQKEIDQVGGWASSLVASGLTVARSASLTCPCVCLCPGDSGDRVDPQRPVGQAALVPVQDRAVDAHVRGAHGL